MSVISPERRDSSKAPGPRLWTREEYYRLSDLGFFEGQRVELIEGEIVDQHSPRRNSPGPRLWTREEYYRLSDLGFFEGQRAELIEGEIMVQSPQNWPHTAAVTRAFQALNQVFGQGYWVRMQLPLTLMSGTEPEPDISVVTGPFEAYADHPTSAVLVVEVSETSLEYDRGPKASLYAASQVPDYWIVNLVNQRLEVYRNPTIDASQPCGWRYALRSDLAPGESVSPRAMPGKVIAVTSFLIH